ncbi:DUF7146 domain-containing protein [Amaricoccus solimangrovi]|uniref:Uncharacterized protein n=1 Tax=Amaricoccus solimangrovi TaxID=2589815 RepID=A0A501WYB5_9RHOB|nr:toprim domain-containing protein [Amaricoccus solimangrovi]TPE53224.1 hypothetical protein FJM51_04180 [Amaricoccus solimangrovi]
MNDPERITRALGGCWNDHSGGSACCPAHEDKHPSLSIGIGADGRLLLHCFAGCSFEAIVAALRGLGILEGRGAIWKPDAADLARLRAAEESQLVKQSARAKAVWDEAESIPATIAEAYLRARGITCELPATLRFLANGWHPTARRFPMMVAAVEGGSRFAVHRTYLRADGRGKADVEPVKAMLGPTAGGAVRLSEGEGPLVVAEGIETALALLSGLLRRPATVWAALSTSGMRALNLPPIPGKLTIASDGDAPGRAAAHALATRAAALGWRVSMLPAPEGRDWADILAMKGAAA